ncbi:GAP family protein [Solicola gregarius]|uniref:GAP family protein n=1 Tax=Solicola gregarius TaxID=2908642 RepID=A0AA46TE23_9ACTN|nr:GAP family protein [Solicola gregarius]UYM03622.1 GAP family protein [Solicola gregarius]
MSGLAAVLGDLLPSAIGIAISPLPIIAAVLMLMSERASRTAPAFALGWVVGLTAVTVIVLVVAGPNGADTGSSSTTASWIKLVLGVLFLGLAYNTWRKRPRAGAEVEPPKWMRGLDSMKPLAASGLGAALAAVNPKNLMLAVGGAVAIAAGDLETGATIVCVVVFVLLASVMVAGPVVAYFVARDAMLHPLEELKSFMQEHNAAIMMVLLTVLGVSNLGKGLGGLLD